MKCFFAPADLLQGVTHVQFLNFCGYVR